MRKIAKAEAQMLNQHCTKLEEAQQYIVELLERAENYAEDRSEEWQDGEGGAEHAELRESLEAAQQALEEAVDALSELIPA
jgi:predicted urease superfamily metal-dependent hydrolase